MELSRRQFSVRGIASAIAPLAFPASAGLIIPSSSKSRGQDAAAGGGDASYSAYQSTLVNGLTPSSVVWNGRKWRCAAGSSWNPGMDYSVRLTAHKARFELRNTENDHGERDPVVKRRAELHSPARPRLPNDVPLWGAMSFIHHHWADPAGMATRWGGAHGQLHIGSTFGGSPAVAFRRHGDGKFRISTRGEFADDNTVRYDAPLAFDVAHDLVYRVVLSPTNGSLMVWLNRRKIVDLHGVSIGSHQAECYWNIGNYYAGGVTCPVIAEFANHVYPDPASLAGRLAVSPGWPAA